jgi:hypothetical protein
MFAIARLLLITNYPENKAVTGNEMMLRKQVNKTIALASDVLPP